MQEQILWVDDEIDLLKAYIILLQEKGYKVHTANNGDSAIEILSEENIDIIFLDENMPGKTGLETLTEIKLINNNVPVVMITKNEEEELMDDAIGSNISDYLIKPISPKQISLVLKKHLTKSNLVYKKMLSNFHSEFNKITINLLSANSLEEFIDIYKRLVFWELEIDNLKDDSLIEIYNNQKKEANKSFSRFIEKNYIDLLDYSDDKSVRMSHNILEKNLLPSLEKEKIVLIVIDNLRYGQWKILEKYISEYYNTIKDEPFLSILPTSTQYARNALFAGLMPLSISKKYPNLWIDENDNSHSSKNEYEHELIKKFLERKNKTISTSYHKILNVDFGKRIEENINKIVASDLSILVYNFIDMLSHSKTDSNIVKELADNDAAYRSLTESWFKHSNLFNVIKKLVKKKIKIMLTTDHGSIDIKNPVKIISTKEASTNLRYKLGKTIDFKKKEAFAIQNPEEIYIPKQSIREEMIFARSNDFFVYQKDFHKYANYYKNTYQHGGVSMEEMIIPFVVLSPK